MAQKPVSIVFDGPAGVGKSTIAKAIARKLGYAYIDTGAMYRAVTLFALEQGIPIDAEYQEAMLELALRDNFRFVFVGENLRIYFGQRDISKAVRSLEVTRHVSHVAALPAIRQGLREIQRQMAASTDVVIEGRDIGTVVLPDATYKFFLTAAVEVRARRRYLELRAQGIAADLEEIRRSIQDRDRLDSSRTHSPLRKADDAIEIDTSSLSIQGVVDLILSYIK
ncbi:MAG: (d)CMP kinase [Bacillota bacterium]|jgi:cytidylate kinase